MNSIREQMNAANRLRHFYVLSAVEYAQWYDGLSMDNHGASGSAAGAGVLGRIGVFGE
jgi:hypothetical protein